MDFHIFNGFPYMSWTSIYVMDFHIFHGFPFTEYYKILQLLTIINKGDICIFFQNISEKITTHQKGLEIFFKKFLKKLQHQNKDTGNYFQKVSEKLKHPV